MNKSCNKCNKEFPATSSYFYRDRGKRDGLTTTCKPCKNSSNKRWNNENVERTKEIQSTWYQDNKNRILKERIEYRRNNKEAINMWFEENKEHRKLYRQKYQVENKERIREKKRMYNESLVGKYNKKLCDQRYRNTEHGREADRRATNKRRTLKLRLPSNFSKEEWISCKEHFNNLCAYCGKKEVLTIEHFIPLSKNGELTINNVIPSCRSCNSSKQNKDFFEWYPRRKSYSKQREQKILQYLNYDKNNMQQLALL